MSEYNDLTAGDDASTEPSSVDTGEGNHEPWRDDFPFFVRGCPHCGHDIYVETETSPTTCGEDLGGSKMGVHFFMECSLCGWRFIGTNYPALPPDEKRAKYMRGTFYTPCTENGERVTELDFDNLEDAKAHAREIGAWVKAWSIADANWGGRMPNPHKKYGETP